MRKARKLNCSKRPSSPASFAAIFAFAAVSVFLASCGDSGNIKNSNGDQGEDYCLTTNDCSVGYTCKNNRCVPAAGDQDAETEANQDFEVADETDGAEITDETDAANKPRISVQPEFSVGATLINSTVQAALSISNSGLAPLTLKSFAFQHSGTSGFSVKDAPTRDVVVQPSAAFTLNVLYAKSRLDADEDKLEITSDDPETPTAIVRFYSELKGNPVIEANSTKVEFGPTPLGKSARLTITIKNTDVSYINKPLVIDNITITAGGTVFSVDPAFVNPIYVTPDSPYSFSAVFAPLDEIDYEGKIEISSNSTGGDGLPYAVSLTGTGVKARLDAAPDPVSFGTVKVGTTAKKDLVLSNQGKDSLYVKSVSLKEGGSGFFKIDAMPIIPEGGYVLAFKDEFKVSLSYNATAVGKHETYAVVESSDPSIPKREIKLQGEAIETAIVIDPPSVEFEKVRVGTNAAPITVTATNDTPSTELKITVSELKWDEGNYAGVFSLSDAPQLPVTLAKGEKLEFKINFRPAAETPSQAILTLITDGTGSQPQISVTGSGALPHIAVNPPAALNLGEVVVGKTAAQDVVVTNNGALPLIIDSANLGAGGSSHLSLTPSGAVNITIEPSKSALLTVTFAPPASANPSEALGLLTIKSNDPDKPSYDVQIKAAAVKPMIDAAPVDNPIYMGKIIVAEGCQAQQKTITLRNIGALGSLIIDKIEKAEGSSPNFTLSGLPASWPVVLLPYSENQMQISFTVSYAPSGQDAHYGIIKITSNAFNEPTKSLNLKGEGYYCLASEHVCSCACAANNSLNHCGDRCSPCPNERENADAVCAADQTSGLFACGYKCKTGYVEQNGVCIPSNTPDCCGTACVDCTLNPSIPLHSAAVCKNGQCSFACVAPWIDCNAAIEGCETDGGSDALNCGGCDLKCPSKNNSTVECLNSKCAYTCNDGYKDCNKDITDGCEINVNADIQHCSECFSRCPDPQPNSHQHKICVNAICGFECDAGYHACNGVCYSDLDAAHCGKSCRDCASGVHANVKFCAYSAKLGDYVCNYECEAGYGDCTTEEGCETDVKTIDDCGVCGNRCTYAPTGGHPTCEISGSSRACSWQCDSGWHKVGDHCERNSVTSCCGVSCKTCTSGAYSTPTCVFSETAQDYVCSCSCSTGFGDCDNVCSPNGCETQLNTVNNCLACNAKCVDAPLNGRPICLASGCSWECNPNYRKCGSGCYDEADGAHCGSNCYNCNADPNVQSSTCSSGVCVYSCKDGYKDCDSNPGCETKLGTVNACSDCGDVCGYAPPNGYATCEGGTCSFQCNAGYHKCGSVCKKDDDVSYCGSACVNCANGAPANTSAACVNNACQYSCNAGYADCSAGMTNGCEVNLSSPINTCVTATEMFASGSTNTQLCGDQTATDGSGNSRNQTYIYTLKPPGSFWMKLKLNECSSSIFPTDLDVRFTLDVPAGINYDLYVYQYCGTGHLVASRQGTGMPDSVCIWWPDNQGIGGHDDSYYVYAEVRFSEGTSCETVSLSATSFNGTTGCTKASW